MIITQVFNNGSEAAGRSFFADLLALEPLIDGTASIPYEKVNSLLNHAAGYAGRKQFSGGAFTLPISVEAVTQLYDSFNAFVSSKTGLGESMVLFETMPYGKVMEVGNGEMAFANRGEYYNLAVMMKWFDESLDEEIRSFARNFLRDAASPDTPGEMEGVRQYVNYAGTFFPLSSPSIIPISSPLIPFHPLSSPVIPCHPLPLFIPSNPLHPLSPSTLED